MIVMEITLGGAFSPSPDNHARRSGFEQNTSYASVDKSIVGYGAERVERTPQDGREQDKALQTSAEKREDTFELSSEARQMSRQMFDAAREQDPNAANADRAANALGTGRARAAEDAENEGQDQTKTAEQAGDGKEDSVELSPDAQKMVDALKARDREVRAHEAAHVAAGAGIVQGGAQFSLQRGPDGNMYAIGGEVSIDASPVSNDPEATAAKARQIVAAAMAPADPSPQDRSVAAQARAMEAAANAEIANSAVDTRNNAGTSTQNNARTNANSQTASRTDTQANSRTDARADAQASRQDDAQGLTTAGRQAVSAYSAALLRQTTDPVAQAYQTVA
jgi:hypothetical protein